jgi:hypothetical protein
MTALLAIPLTPAVLTAFEVPAAALVAEASILVGVLIMLKYE